MRTLLLITIACISLMCTPLFAQQATTDFWEDPERYVPVAEPSIVSDMELFNVPVEGGGDVFSRLARYNFSAVRYSRRGYDNFISNKIYLEGLELGNALSGRYDYTLLGALRYAPGARNYSSGAAFADGAFGGWCGIEQYSVRPSGARTGGAATLLATDRSGRAGARVTLAGGSEDGKWNYGLYAGRRWGRDAHVDGLFMDETAASLSLEKRWGEEGGLSVFVMAAPTERSIRSSSTQEAFDLTGDNLYNPSWGWCEGEQRSSRVRKTFTPLGVIAYQGQINERNLLRVAASFITGESSYSGLSWYDAQSPLPDYYRYMPSFISNPTISQKTAGFWRAGDQKVTQIDWQELIDQNIMAGSQAVYVADQDVERYANAQFVASVRSRPERRLEINYGARLRLDNTGNFNRLKDLLGAGYVTDVDQWLVDDEFYGNMAQNDMRHPDRKVTEGDRFSYNYRLGRTAAALFGAIAYGEGRLRLRAGVEAGNAMLWREGLYEKELYPGVASYGKSENFRFFEYMIKIGVGYSFSPRHFVDANLLVNSAAPLAADLFLNPRFNNLTASDPRESMACGGELSYRFLPENFSLKVTGFYTLLDRATDIIHYYDDLSSTYSDLVMSELSKQYYGVEMGAEAILSPRFTLLAGFSAGSYTYASDPRMDLYSDADATPVYTGESSPMKNYRLGAMPQTVISGELHYSGMRGWMASLTVNYMADSYISPDPTRRMRRATNYASSPEAFAEMTVQEKFDPAATVGLFLFKSFDLGSGKLQAAVSVNNLLDNRNIVYSGYEQMRLRRAGEGINRTYAPFDSKYLYGYGRTYYCSLTYKF